MEERLVLIQIIKQLSSRILLNARHFHFVENVHSNGNI